jgi:lipoate-protein ligase A
MASGAAGRRGGGAAVSGQKEFSSPPYRARENEALSLTNRPAAPLPRWYLWTDDLPRPGYANMALDTVLLHRANRLGESWLRLYQWEPYCLSFGRHEPATRRYDVGQIRKLGVDTVRRPTGGRAVWHARELTYAVAAPSWQFGSLQDAYLEIHRMIAEGLRRIGVRVSFAAAVRVSSLDAGACFAQPAGGELLLAGRKIVGSAQYRHGKALLQHGSILLEDDQQMVLAVTRGATSSPKETSPGPLRNRLARPPELAQSIARAAAERWSGRWSVASPESVLSEGSSWYPHYRSTAWTWMR